MGERSRKADWPILCAVVATLVLALGAYIGCYYAMSDLRPSLAAAEMNSKPGLVRFYDAKWKATIFTPATKVESLLRGQPVQTLAFDGWEPFEVWKD
jgi:hypothetical protein